jgi:hypothetical protein
VLTGRTCCDEFRTEVDHLGIISRWVGGKATTASHGRQMGNESRVEGLARTNPLTPGGPCLSCGTSCGTGSGSPANFFPSKKQK